MSDYFNQIQYTALDGSKGISQEIVIKHYDLSDIYTHFENFLAYSFKKVMDSLINHSDHTEDAPSYEVNNDHSEFTSYYKYHTFTVRTSHLINSSEKTPLTIQLSIKANSDEETMETRRELNAIRNRTFNRLVNIILDHGKVEAEIHYEKQHEYDYEDAYDKYQSRYERYAWFSNFRTRRRLSSRRYRSKVLLVIAFAQAVLSKNLEKNKK